MLCGNVTGLHGMGAFSHCGTVKDPVKEVDIYGRTQRGTAVPTAWLDSMASTWFWSCLNSFIIILLTFKERNLIFWLWAFPVRAAGSCLPPVPHLDPEKQRPSALGGSQSGTCVLLTTARVVFFIMQNWVVEAHIPKRASLPRYNI